MHDTSGQAPQMAQEAQAMKDGKTDVRKQILLAIDAKGAHRSYTYKGMAVSLRVDAGLAKQTMDTLVREGYLLKGKGGYHLLH